MSYWHSKIPAQLQVYKIDAPTYYIYFGKQPICSVYFNSGIDIIMTFGKICVVLDQFPANNDSYSYLPREVKMQYIFKNLRGLEKVNSSRERAAVFVTKCKLQQSMFNRIKLFGYKKE